MVNYPDRLKKYNLDTRLSKYGIDSSSSHFYELGRLARERKEEERRKKAEKTQQENALSDFLERDLTFTDPSKPPALPKKDDEGDGFIDNVGGLLKDVGSDIFHAGSTALRGLGLLGKTIIDPDYTMEDMRKEVEKQQERNKEVFTPYSEDYSSDLSREVGRAFKRAGSGATFGLMEDSIRQNDLGASAYEERDGVGGVADIGYEILGSLGPGGVIAGGLRGTRAGANLTGDMTRLQRAGQRSKEGAVAGGIYGGLESVARGEIDPSRILLESAFGAVADPALGELFDVLSKGFNRSNVPSTNNQVERVRQEKPVTSEPTPAMRNVLSSLPVPDIQLPSYSGAIPRVATDFRVERVADPAQILRQREASVRGNIGNMQQQRESLLKDLEDLRKDYTQTRRAEYEGIANEEEVAKGAMEWENVKKQRERYRELLKNTEKFYIPKEHREEYGKLFPRSFISSDASMDIFKASETAGYSGDHEGVLQFAHDLRNMQQNMTIRKKDVVPEIEPIASSDDLKEVERIAGLEFEQTDDYAGIRKIIDTLDEEINNPSVSGNVADAFRVSAEGGPQLSPFLDMPLAGPRELPTNKQILDFGNQSARQNESILSRTDRALVRGSDRFRAVKTVERKVRSAGKEFENTFKNAYRNIRLVPGASGAGERFLEKNMLEPMNDLTKRGLDIKEGWEYVTSKHLNRVMELDPEYKSPNGANKEQMEHRIARLGRNPLNENFARVIQNIQRDMLAMLEESGVISNELHQELIEKFPDYVPLFRQKDAKNIDTFLDKFTSGNVRKVIHELQSGSDDLIKDPLDNFVNYVMGAHHASFSNRAMQSLADLNNLKLNGKLLAKDVTNMDPSKRGKFTVKFKQNGKDKVYELHEDLYVAYNEMKQVLEPNAIVRIAEGIAKFQRQSITANPIFTVRQLVRDIPEAYVNGNFSLTRDLMPAFFDIISNGRIKNSQLDNFYKHGAGFGNIVSMDRTSNYALKRASKKALSNKNYKDVAESAYLNTIGNVFDGLRRFNEAMENLPKMAQFRATARRTGDLDQAGFEARDIMDFAMSGRDIQKINRFVAFINANIRGKERFTRSLKDKPLATIMKTTTVGAGMSIAGYMAYENLASDKQKELIETAPEWLKQTYWLFPSKNGEDILRIPKPYEMSIISSTPLEFALYNENMVGSDVKDYLKNWFTESFLVDASLNPVTPLYEVATNRSLFRGADITSGRESHLDEGQQGDVYTPTLAKGIGNLTGINPRRIEHLMRGYSPTTSENVNALIDRVAELTGLEENQKPAGTAGSVENMFNPFIVRGNTMYSDRIGDIYEGADEVQALKKRTQQEEGELFQYPNAYRAINKIRSADQDYASQIRAIDNDPNLDRQQKKELREQLIAERNANANTQVGSGRLDINEENLSELDQEFSGLGASTTKTDVKAVITARLQQLGVPTYVINNILNQDLSDEQLANALRKIMADYQ